MKLPKVNSLSLKGRISCIYQNILKYIFKGSELSTVPPLRVSQGDFIISQAGGFLADLYN